MVEKDTAFVSCSQKFVFSHADTLHQPDVTERAVGKIDLRGEDIPTRVSVTTTHNFQTEKILTAGFKFQK
jgi:hypothetical protein